MKQFLLIIGFLISDRAIGQYPYHRCLTFKSDLLSLVNIAVEVPVYHGLTMEFGVRDIAYDLPGEQHQKRSFRGNIKFHFPKEDFQSKYYSFYVFSGIHYQTHFLQFENSEYGDLDVTKGVLGIGSKRRRYDLWIAIENAIDTRQNSLLENSVRKSWKRPLTFTGGISINIWNIKI